MKKAIGLFLRVALSIRLGQGFVSYLLVAFRNHEEHTGHCLRFIIVNGNCGDSNPGAVSNMLITAVGFIPVALGAIIARAL